MPHRQLTPAEIIESLRLSLAHAQSITTLLQKRHPEVYKELIQALPPPKAKELETTVELTPAFADYETHGVEDSKPQTSTNNDNNDNNDNNSTNSDFTPEPQHTEETAGELFADSRNMERDLFFKARIAEGIDDDKIVDTGPKVDARKVMARGLQDCGYTGVVDVMRMYPEDEGVQRHGLKNLLPFTTQEDARVVLGRMGAIDAVLNAMQVFGASSIGVAHFSIRVLGNLAFSCSDNRAVIAVKAVDFILVAMSTYLDNSELQKDACTTLTNVAHDNDTAKRSIAAKGGVDSILSSMERYLGDIKVQKAACWAILTVAADATAGKRAAADGAVGALLAAMVNFEDEEEIQYYSLWGLSNLAQGSDALSKFVVDNGACGIAQTAVINFPDHQGVREKAQELLQRVDAFIPKVEL